MSARDRLLDLFLNAGPGSQPEFEQALSEYGSEVRNEPALFAACTPNSLPDAEGHVEHGFQINVLDAAMTILTTIDLPDWETFRPASAGHRLIEHGYMIRPDARGPETVNGWNRVGQGFTAPVLRLEDES